MSRRGGPGGQDPKAKIQLQIRDERARHSAKMQDLSDRRREATATALNSIALAAKLTRIMHQEFAERDRHRRAITRLHRRINA